MEQTPDPSHRLAVLALTLGAMIGCTAAPNPELPQPTAIDVGAREVPREILWVAAAPEYGVLVEQVYRDATARVEELSAERETGTWGVILDVDETVLSNVRYEIEGYHIGRSFELKSWHDWCRRKEATAIPGVLSFLRRTQELGGRIALVTNRLDEVADATQANLEALEIPFDLLLTKSTTSDKTERLDAVQGGTASALIGPLEILLYIGDNILDFPGHGAAAEHSRLFGDRYFLVPNPLYGSWETKELPD